MEKAGIKLPNKILDKDIEMAEIAQRLLMEPLDHLTAAEITLSTDQGKYLTIPLPLASLLKIGEILGTMIESQSITLMQTKQYAALKLMSENAKELGLDD
jgi:hypothetical protein